MNIGGWARGSAPLLVSAVSNHNDGDGVGLLKIHWRYLCVCKITIYIALLDEAAKYWCTDPIHPTKPIAPQSALSIRKYVV